MNVRKNRPAPSKTEHTSLLNYKGSNVAFEEIEGDFYQLFKEVEQIRKEETKALYRQKFRALIKEAQFVSFSIDPKIEDDEHISE